MPLIVSPIYIATVTDAGGAVSINIKVPGTYDGVVPSNPASARYLSYLSIWADPLASGDLFDNFKITDTDGKLTPEEQALFPDYPDIYRFSDPEATPTGILVLSNPLLIYPADKVLLLPSELYLQGTFTAQDSSPGKIFRANIVWSRWVDQ